MKATESNGPRRQAASFAAAGRGLWLALRQEAHLRFHIAAAAAVLYISRWFSFSRGDYAVLFALFGFVIGLECVNTALERLCDRVCAAYDKAIGAVKDAAAGAVLAAAVCAAAAGIVLFWQPAGLAALWQAHKEPLRIGVSLALGTALVLFIRMPAPKAKKDPK